MEDILFGLIAVIAVIVRTINKAKKVKQNAPGRTMAPSSPVPKAYTERSVPGRTMTADPTDVSQPGNFWQQFGRVVQEEEQNRGHEAVGRMAEGDSRECAHGSVGGSMAYKGHTEGGTDKKTGRSAQNAGEKPGADVLYRPAMNAQEMRRAVVMAEILKRPQERMVEQARRWTAR